jgi:hypothetical protein
MVGSSYLLFSVVRFTDFVTRSGYPSDESLGYFQSSAKGGLAQILFVLS